MTRFFEDVPIGEEIALGSHAFDAEAIKDFARQFDPQPFHLDEEAAAHSLFGGLAASGWHTAAGWMTCFVAWRKREAEEMAARGERLARPGPSPGFRDMKWLKPVHPGDTISYRARVIDKVELRSRPEWGLVVSLNEGFNQKGELVFSFVGQVMTERRAAPARP